MIKATQATGAGVSQFLDIGIGTFSHHLADEFTFHARWAFNDCSPRTVFQPPFFLLVSAQDLTHAPVG
jgi:hypothetical protein